MSTFVPLQLQHLPSPQTGDVREWSNSLIYRETVDGKTYLHIPPGIEVAKHLEDVVQLTLDLLAMNRCQRASGNTMRDRFDDKLDERLKRALRLSPAQLNEHFPKHRLHPYVELFVKCAESESLFDYHTLGKSLSKAEQMRYAAARQRMLTALREGALHPVFRRRVKSHNDRVKRNLRVIRKYTDAQFRHSRLLVVRVDCLFVDDFAPAHEWTQARAYREALIKFLNKDLPKAIQPMKRKQAKLKPEPTAGYVIGTEYGIEAGWHFHVTLFLNGNDFEDDVGIASLICSTWKQSIAGGNGRYYNCNLAAKRGQYRDKEGLGMIHRDEVSKREILRSKVTSYGCKGCYYAESQTGTKDRLLNKGRWPKEKDPKKGGRPAIRRSPDWILVANVFSEKKKRFSPIWKRQEAPQPSANY